MLFQLEQSGQVRPGHVIKSISAQTSKSTTRHYTEAEKMPDLKYRNKYRIFSQCDWARFFHFCVSCMHLKDLGIGNLALYRL